MLNEIKGDIWEHPCPIKVIPTNGFVKSNGALAMGKGLAAEAAARYPDLPFEWGAEISKYGYKNIISCTTDDGIILLTGPTKHMWYEKANIALVRATLSMLNSVRKQMAWEQIALPRLGCGYGQLNWETHVKKYAEQYLAHEGFIIVDKTVEE